MIAKSKYKAIKTEVDGIVFASKKEAKRYSELKWLEKGGRITDLELQPKFDVVVCGVKICTYKADYKYYEVSEIMRGESVRVDCEKMIVEDVKGFKTPVYRLKKKLVEAIYGIEIREI